MMFLSLSFTTDDRPQTTHDDNKSAGAAVSSARGCEKKGRSVHNGKVVVVSVLFCRSVPS